MPDHDVLIIGGGISGLSALHFLKHSAPELEVALVEGAERPGGTIGTDHIDGYSLDWGPNGFLDREPLTLQLAEEIGLSDRLERANENVSKRFILRGGKLREVPMSPAKFLTSDILSVKGRLRVLMEPLVPGRTDDGDESVYDFARRRIGREAADFLVQSMVSGVYGGLAEQLSLQSCFPIMSEMEREHGSLVRAMIARKRKAKAEGRKSGGPGGPSGWLTSVHGGLYGFVERFHEKYGSCIQCGKEILELQRDRDIFHADMAGDVALRARQVIIATPSYAAADLVRSLSSPVAEALGAIPYAPIAVVCLGYREEQVRRALDGFGFLVPRVERRRILGSIWTSSIFADRAPDGRVQFRTMVGGDGDHGVIELSDDELARLVVNDLDAVLGISGEPELVKTYRWERGIPQFKIGHAYRMKSIEDALERIPGLHVSGNAYYGISLNDCVKQSHKVAARVRTELAGR